MYHKILVPLDGSKFSEQVLPQVGELAKCMGAQVVLLRIVPAPFYETVLIPANPVTIPPSPEHDTYAQATGYLQRVAFDDLPEGLDVKLEVASGPAAETILDFADGEEADLIAMTTHGRGGVARLVMGSVAGQIVHNSHSPVLLVRPH